MKAVVFASDLETGRAPFPADHPIVIATGNETFCTSVAATMQTQLEAMGASAGSLDLQPGITAIVVTTEDTVSIGDSLDSVSGLYRKHV